MTILVACLWLATSPLWGKIVFYSFRDGNTEIYTMDSDGGNQTRLTFPFGLPMDNRLHSWVNGIRIGMYM